MAHALYTNNAVATLASGISAGDTSATLTAGQGALFPNPLTGNYFWGTLNDAATGLVIEIVQVAARSTDTLTIVRAQQGTTANAYLAGDKFELRVTAQGLQDLQPASELGAAAYDNIVTIANGGTNSSSYTAPAGGISPLVYYDGTKFSTDAVVADAGYNTSTNTINSTNFVASANLSGTSFKLGFQSIATNGGTTTFTVTSPYYTIFTGTQGQTVVLPDATTLSVGWKYGVDNDSTQSITINANGGGAFWIVAPGCDLYITLSSNASAAGTWEKDYNAAKVANGKGVTINNSLTLSGTDGTTMTFPSTSSTVVTTSTLNGGTLAASTTSLTDSGNLTFTGTGNRITGDFSNATIANRVMFQSSTVNGATSVTLLPNGTSVQSQLALYGSTDVTTNYQLFDMNTNGVVAKLRQLSAGTSAYLPMTFETGGSERMRIDTSGNVGIGTTPAAKFHLKGSDASNALYRIQSTDGTGNFGDASVYGAFHWYQADGTTQSAYVGYGGAANSFDIVNPLASGLLSFKTGSSYTERMRIDSSGNVSLSTSANATQNISLSNVNAGASAVSQFILSSNSGTLQVETGSTAGGIGARVLTNGIPLGMGTLGAQAINLATSATTRMLIDSSGNVLVTSTGGLGYGTGSGGAVTQATSKSTPVSLNKTNGQITLNGAALAANTLVSFLVNNNTVVANDLIIVNQIYNSGTNGAYLITAQPTANGFLVNIKNISAGSLSEAFSINFAVIKAVTA